VSCGLSIELEKKEVTKMLHICQGNCFCESSGNNFAKAKVLYCYGEFVPQRTIADSEEEDEESPWFLDIEMLEVFQLILVVFFILAILVVLLTIRSGISMIERQLKKVVVNLKRTPSWSSDEDNLAEAGNLNRVFLKKDNGGPVPGGGEYKDSFDMDIATVNNHTLQKK